MPFRIAHSHNQLAVAVAFIAIVSIGGWPTGRRQVVGASVASLEFVGNLIARVHFDTWNRLEPTYPRPFDPDWSAL